MRIATYLNAQGELGDFLGSGSICVFDKLQNHWQKLSSTPLEINAGLALSEMKRIFSDAVTPIAQCQVFLVRDLRGIFRVFLEDWGFHVWKSSGSLEQQLELVEALENEQQIAAPEAPLPAPIGDVKSGIYHINLLDLMQSGIPHMSREILLPFFETTSFARLEIICDHLPRWLPFELDELGLRLENQKAYEKGDGLQIIILPRSGERTSPKGRRKRNFSCSCGG